MLQINWGKKKRHTNSKRSFFCRFLTFWALLSATLTHDIYYKHFIVFHCELTFKGSFSYSLLWKHPPGWFYVCFCEHSEIFWEEVGNQFLDCNIPTTLVSAINLYSKLLWNAGLGFQNVIIVHFCFPFHPEMGPPSSACPLLGVL